MKSLLKFITCGSVDDGKSTLIGHMLYDAKLLYSDQEQALELDSRVGSRGGEIDYSLLLDGLMAEREQGITIDVAYRYFTTDKRSFIVADTPGHEEYTRNMAVGASFADLAVILVDACNGILTQTKRHVRICSMMGIRHFVFAVNKMDILSYRYDTFQKIEKDIKKLSIDLDISDVAVIPVSATEGDNVTVPSQKMGWYQGSTLLSFLEDVNVEEENEEGFVLPVQRVCRPDSTFRGFQGEVQCGTLKTGDVISVLPGGESAEVASILVTDREEKQAFKNDAVTVTLTKEIDVSRGSVITKDTELYVSNLFTSTLLWMDDKELIEGRTYIARIGTREIPATVISIKYKIDINSGEHKEAKLLNKNEIAVCDVLLSEKCVFDKFSKHRSIGRFILIDRVTNNTSAGGVIEHPLRRADNLTWQELDITRELRMKHMGQKAVTLWFTGLSGSGKSTIANALEKRLFAEGKYTMLLDGDNVRMGLNSNLGFTEEDRVENIRRVAEVAKLFNDAGIIVLTAFISPYASDRDKAREIIGRDCFTEIFVDTPLEECIRRDVKGLYRKAKENIIPNFTGISSPYETPEDADIVISTMKESVEESVDKIMEYLF